MDDNFELKPVNQIHLTPRDSYILLENGEDPEILWERICKQTDREFESLPQADIPSLLLYGFNLAINDVAESTMRLTNPDFKSTSAKNMAVLFLNNREFEQAYNYGGVKLSESNAWGFSVPDSKYAIVKNVNLPAYLTASVAQHELTHQFVESQLYAYSIITLQDGRKALAIEQGRSGLNIRHRKIVENTPLWQVNGELLNELGNYWSQHEFMEKLLDDQRFKQEREIRKNCLMEIFGDDSGVVTITKEGVNPVLMDLQNFHFDNEGKPLHNTLPFLMTQLAQDLHHLTSHERLGTSMGSAIWYAKTNPGWQSSISRAIDANMGRGYFRKLKELGATSENVLMITSEVQNVIEERGY